MDPRWIYANLEDKKNSDYEYFDVFIYENYVQIMIVLLDWVGLPDPDVLSIRFWDWDPFKVDK